MNIHAKIDPNPTEKAFADAFALRQTGLTERAENALANLRRSAITRFNRLGLPHRRIEDWHYTDLRRLLKATAAEPSGTASVELDAVAAHTAFAGLNPARLVFAGGRFIADQSDLDHLGDGVDVQPMSAKDMPEWALREIEMRRPQGDNAIFDLSSALMSDGALIKVGANNAPLRPIEIVNVSSGGGTAVRHVVVLEAGASLRLIETASGDGAMSLSAMSVSLGEGAWLDHVKVQNEGAATTHIAPIVAEVGDKATLNTFTLTTGAALAREERHVRFAGTDTLGSISGAFLLSGKTHADTTLQVSHDGTGGNSREVFRGIVDDRAKSVVQNRVTVSPGAQKTDARQAVHVLLLSDEAEHNTKPELEIYADDVQCAHGATIGELDENALFYLMARGITRAVAETLLIEAFVAGAMDEIADEAFRDVISRLATARLDERKSNV